MVAKRKWVVREVVQVVIDDDESFVAEFDSFFDACDFVDDHPEMNLFIELVDA